MKSLDSRPLRRFALAALAAGWVVPAAAALGYDEALSLAREQAPALVAQQAVLAGARAAQPAAATLPDPRLSLGLDNLPISGRDRFNISRDFMTMQRIALAQDVPNRAKRQARADVAQARVEREQAMLVVAQLALKRDAALAWLQRYFAEQRGAFLARLAHENQLLIDTLAPRIAAGRAMPAEHAMARQEALALADRQDDAARDVARARSALRRWVGARADEPLQGEPGVPLPQAETLRATAAHSAEIAPYEAMQALARAEAAEVLAEQRGDWGWEVAYARRSPAYSDMVSVQISMDLPWQKAQRQQPMLAAKQQEQARVLAERDDMIRRHQAEIEAQLAELAALDAQHARLQGAGSALAAERVALAQASYQASRSDLGAVLAARREQIEVGLRLLDLEAQRLALRVRLTTLTAE